VKSAIEVSTNDDTVFIRAERKQKEIEIKIIDTGFGMSEEKMNSLGKGVGGDRRKHPRRRIT